MMQKKPKGQAKEKQLAENLEGQESKSQGSKGAEAYVNDCVFLGIPAISKRRLPKRYRIPELDRRLRRERTLSEARALSAAKATGALCPIVYYVDLEKTEIIMQKLEGELLSRIDASTRKKFAKLAGELLGKIHLAGIHHGDYTTTNLMACGGKLYVIDFGLSERSAKAEDFATDVLLFKKSVGKEEFADFLAGYKQSFEGKYAEVIGSLKNIEERGRYVARGQ